jgi:excisionase family DNA binding protein
MSFTIPPLPGETLITAAEVARRVGCSRPAIVNAIEHGKIAAVAVAGRVLITESEAERYIRERIPNSLNPAVSNYWLEYRDWKAARAAAASGEVA